MGKTVDWSPWEERTIEGFGPVVRVEITKASAFDIQEIALKHGMAPEAVLNGMLSYALEDFKRTGALPEVPS